MRAIAIRRGLWTMGLLVGIAALALVGPQGAQASNQLARAGTETVGIKNFAFHPGTLRVGRGTTVVFANHSDVTHTATRGGLFDKVIKPGRRALVRFGQRGSFRYHCTIHPFMRGTIVVE
jgi:plastocyanin